MPPKKLAHVIVRERLVRSMWNTKLKNRDVSPGEAATARAQTMKLAAATIPEAKDRALIFSFKMRLLSSLCAAGAGQRKERAREKEPGEHTEEVRPVLAQQKKKRRDGQKTGQNPVLSREGLTTKLTGW